MSDALVELGSIEASTLSASADGGRLLDLATGPARTPAGLVGPATFFRGFVARPEVAAAGLLAVADVAATRYADAGAMQRLAMLDPIVTASGDRLRFESFSACNGVHARFDLLADGTDGAEIGWGTTNVDISQPLRTALATITPHEPLHLTVGRDELRASTPTAMHAERKVRLPERWVRGLAEVSVISSAMTPALVLDGTGARQLLGALPRVAPPGPDVHLVPTPRGLRQVQRAVPGSVPLPGAARLRGADRLARFATSLAVHRHRSGATAWVLEVPGGRLTLVVSAGPYRGFSGEGGLLALLCEPDVERTGTWLQAELGWDPVVDPEALAAATGLPDGAVAAGLAWLAASGRLGHDLAEGRWFHRELPVDAASILARNPRLVSAQRLVDGGALARAADGWSVEGAQHPYAVSVDATTCSCRWAIEEPDRGPCKHRLAVLLMTRPGADPAPA